MEKFKSVRNDSKVQSQNDSEGNSIILILINLNYRHNKLHNSSFFTDTRLAPILSKKTKKKLITTYEKYVQMFKKL